MFNMGFSEILVIAILALVFIGPKQLPEVARSLARMINQLKRSMGDVSKDFFEQKKEADTWARDFTTDLLSAAKKLEEEKEKIAEMTKPDDFLKKE
ncbi:MAG: Sec-independent protein translocase protein TatB [Pseudomonadota bacterium]|nr:Sec-independent protein translocase protein TatB [Pseudomonadota bacterium]